MKAAFEFSDSARDLMQKIEASVHAEFKDAAIELLKSHGINCQRDTMKDADGIALKAASSELLRRAALEITRNQSNWSGGTAEGNNFIESCIRKVCMRIVQDAVGFVSAVAFSLPAEA